MPLLTQTQIKIDSNDRWWNGDQPLIHDGILLYFKQNLFKDQSGRYFIHNQFGDKHEYGSLHSVVGFCIHVESIIIDSTNATLRLYLDTTTIVERHASEIYIGGENIVWTELQPTEQPNQLGKSPLPIRFKPGAMAALGHYLYLDANENWGLQFENQRIELQSIKPVF
ncbi:MAG: hypothetical protein H3C43_05605 [Leptonema sp. (in: Bacteria)]|nr:hypothetical protein [Leptonema sp. (in: bacteria)]